MPSKTWCRSTLPCDGCSSTRTVLLSSFCMTIARYGLGIARLHIEYMTRPHYLRTSHEDKLSKRVHPSLKIGPQGKMCMPLQKTTAHQGKVGMVCSFRPSLHRIWRASSHQYLLQHYILCRKSHQVLI